MTTAACVGIEPTRTGFQPDALPTELTDYGVDIRNRTGITWLTTSALPLSYITAYSTRDLNPVRQVENLASYLWTSGAWEGVLHFSCRSFDCTPNDDADLLRGSVLHQGLEPCSTT